MVVSLSAPRTHPCHGVRGIETVGGGVVWPTGMSIRVILSRWISVALAVAITNGSAVGLQQGADRCGDGWMDGWL